MPRSPRPVFAGVPHHITQRGNRREDVFFADMDRVVYLEWLAEYCLEYDVQVLAYCLMTNHVHLVAIPEAEVALEKLFRALHTRYAMRINKLRGWRGHLWQGRYFSSPLGESHLWAAIRYVERNPVRAGIVPHAENYRWSSARAHCGVRSDPVLTTASYWIKSLSCVGDWSRWLAELDDREHLEALRTCAARGLPCGTEEFVRRLEKQAGQPLEIRPRGRPKKQQVCG